MIPALGEWVRYTTGEQLGSIERSGQVTERHETFAWIRTNGGETAILYEDIIGIGEDTDE